MPNDNIPKEEEKVSGEVLSELRNTMGRDKRNSTRVCFNSSIPNNYDKVTDSVVKKELEIEGREEHLLKQSLGIF